MKYQQKKRLQKERDIRTVPMDELPKALLRLMRDLGLEVTE